mmetsp:Transcript_38281/g.109322  ORF Transcript_38281/g.109322 Transcript_38281/m.109322 type:complete len:236 (+) Transcript_38281:920-1627(+)
MWLAQVAGRRGTSLVGAHEHQTRPAIVRPVHVMLRDGSVRVQDVHCGVVDAERECAGALDAVVLNDLLPVADLIGPVLIAWFLEYVTFLAEEAGTRLAQILQPLLGHPTPRHRPTTSEIGQDALELLVENGDVRHPPRVHRPLLVDQSGRQPVAEVQLHHVARVDGRQKGARCQHRVHEKQQEQLRRAEPIVPQPVCAAALGGRLHGCGWHSCRQWQRSQCETDRLRDADEMPQC